MIIQKEKDDENWTKIERLTKTWQSLEKIIQSNQEENKDKLDELNRLIEEKKTQLNKKNELETST